MKTFATLLILLVSSQLILADPQQDIANCIDKLGIPCKQTDTACNAALIEYGNCIMTSSCEQNVTTLSQAIQCLKKCKTGNSNVDAYIDQQANCITKYAPSGTSGTTTTFGVSLYFSGLLSLLFAILLF